MRWYRFGKDFFACDFEKRKMYWMYIEFFGKKQAGKDGSKMRRRINQRFPMSSPAGASPRPTRMLGSTSNSDVVGRKVPCGRIWNPPLQVKEVNGQPQADRKSKDSWMLLCALRRCLDQIQGSNHRKHECRKHQYAKELEAILTNRQVYKPIF